MTLSTSSVGLAQRGLQVLSVLRPNVLRADCGRHPSALPMDDTDTTLRLCASRVTNSEDAPWQPPLLAGAKELGLSGAISECRTPSLPRGYLHHLSDWAVGQREAAETSVLFPPSPRDFQVAKTSDKHLPFRGTLAIAFLIASKPHVCDWCGGRWPICLQIRLAITLWKKTPRMRGTQINFNSHVDGGRMLMAE